ncbi:MAG: peroxiredoxin [Betaproteobacteria bacterium]
MLKVGQPAPAFELPDGDMNVVSPNGYRGVNNVVLYFYPKDAMPGCTLEAIDFSDLQDDFLEVDTVVLGVSMDDCMSHGAFRDKHGLAVQLLADEGGEVCEQYGVLQDKQMEGWGVRRCIVRSTFVIDKSGPVRHVL